MSENKRLEGEKYHSELAKVSLKTRESITQNSQLSSKARKYHSELASITQDSQIVNASIISNINFQDKPLWFPNQKASFLPDNEWTDGRGYFYRTKSKTPTQRDMLFLACLLLEAHTRKDHSVLLPAGEILDRCSRAKDGKTRKRLCLSLDLWREVEIEFVSCFYEDSQRKSYKFRIIKDWTVENGLLLIYFDEQFISKIHDSSYCKGIPFEAYKILTPATLRFLEIVSSKFYKSRHWDIGVDRLIHKIPLKVSTVAQGLYKIKAIIKELAEKEVLYLAYGLKGIGKHREINLELLKELPFDTPPTKPAPSLKMSAPISTPKQPLPISKPTPKPAVKVTTPAKQDKSEKVPFDQPFALANLGTFQAFTQSATPAEASKAISKVVAEDKRATKKPVETPVADKPAPTAPSKPTSTTQSQVSDPQPAVDLQALRGNFQIACWPHLPIEYKNELAHMSPQEKETFARETMRLLQVALQFSEVDEYRCKMPDTFRRIIKNMKHTCNAMEFAHGIAGFIDYWNGKSDLEKHSTQGFYEEVRDFFKQSKETSSHSQQFLDAIQWIEDNVCKEFALSVDTIMKLSEDDVLDRMPKFQRLWQVMIETNEWECTKMPGAIVNYFKGKSEFEKTEKALVKLEDDEKRANESEERLAAMRKEARQQEELQRLLRESNIDFGAMWEKICQDVVVDYDGDDKLEKLNCRLRARFAREEKFVGMVLGVINENGHNFAVSEVVTGDWVRKMVLSCIPGA